MEIKIENDIGSNKISFKQNASGFWYTNDLTINCISIIDGIELAERCIDRINKILDIKNKVSDKKNESKK